MRSHLAGPAWIRAVALVVLAVSILPTSTPSAWAGTCADTVTCAAETVGDATNTVGDTVDATVDATEESAADVVSAVADAVPDPIDPVTDPVLDDVAEVLGHDPTSDPVSGPEEQTGPTDDGGSAGGGSNGPGSGSSSATRHGSGGGASHVLVAITRRGRVHLPPSGRSPTGDETGPVPPRTQLTSPRGGRGAIERVARALRFPALLVALILLFLTFQQRADRRDPKLRHAPLDPRADTLAFR
jgi:hypothetical protein